MSIYHHILSTLERLQDDLLFESETYERKANLETWRPTAAEEAAGEMSWVRESEAEKVAAVIRILKERNKLCAA